MDVVSITTNILGILEFEWIFCTRPLYIFNVAANSHLILILSFICTFIRSRIAIWDENRIDAMLNEDELKNIGICDIYVTENKLQH